MLDRTFETWFLRWTRIFLPILVGVACWPAHGQNAIIPAMMTLGDTPTVSSAAFTTTPVETLKKGSEEPASSILGECSSAFTVRMHVFANGVKYPITGLVHCYDLTSQGITVLPTTTVIKEDVDAGQALHSGDYTIRAEKSIKAGVAIPTLLVMLTDNLYSIVSIEPMQGGEAASPWLTILNDRTNPSDQAVTLRVWRESNKAVEGLLVMSR
jgi:hypothetical protein